MQEADLISSKEGLKAMLLLATYKNQPTTYHVIKNIMTFFTTLLVNVILSEKV